MIDLAFFLAAFSVPLGIVWIATRRALRAIDARYTRAENGDGMSFTRKELVAACTEHERAYRIAPGEFIPEAESLIHWSAEAIGERTADYLISLIKAARS